MASGGRTEHLNEGLPRLLPVARAYSAQVVVVGSATPNKVYDLTRTHSGIRYIMTAPGMSRNDMLSLGVTETGGGVILLTDEAGLNREDWSELLALRLGRGVLPDSALGQNEIPA